MMTRTPDEIKKGLECCAAHDCKGCGYNCGASTCIDSLLKDISALIQQLESDKQQLEGMLTHMNQLRDAAAGRALKMEERAHQLEAERDAAVADLTDMGTSLRHGEACKWCDKAECESDCQITEHDIGFKWRGVQKEDGK